MSLQDRYIEQCTAEEVLSVIIEGLVRQPIRDIIGMAMLSVPNSTASQTLIPNTLYYFPDRTSNLTLTLGTPIAGKASEYHFFIECGSSAPTVTWPIGISWNGGEAPIISPSKTYEVSILNNVAAFFEIG